MNGKVDMNTAYFSFRASGNVIIPKDGRYYIEAGRACTVTINGLIYALSNYGARNGATIALKNGTHHIGLSTINNGGQLPHAAIAIRDAETGQTIPLLVSREEVQKLLNTPIRGVKPIEVSGWKPDGNIYMRAE